MPYRNLSLDEVADYLHLTKQDVEELIKANEIPNKYRGGRYVFIRGEVDAWASQRILGLESRNLVDYHQKTTRGTRAVLDQDALMPDLLRTKYITPALASKTKRSVINDMLELAESTGRVLDAMNLRESVEAREELCSTALPGGMALLHCRQHEPFRFDGSFVVFGRTIQEIPFSAPDGRATRLFFLLCCQDERLHLHTLARICMMALKTDMLLRLHGAPDDEAIYNIIIGSELAALAGKKRLDGELAG
ncbi:MAG: PTS sugar transporter subunit IIA [Opitutaceae bacterium]|jgi:excisionase family DNA binding protein